ncbi:hypothetical protein [Nitriliruptor alkaliphilus]|uniref:hypothetical protein n=1 Tax=Nitriliruptor alkaliphilus TaxID=427918 RepID=UPI00147042E4|nr:hypothetical protein [Nitriliruptor alkaliphilus]
MATSGRRIRPTPAVVVALVLSLVAAVVVLGEPSRPATATVVRPVVTVAALCSAPTVVDVAARDATRGLTAIGQLLGLSDELIGEFARDVRIVDTEAGAFFVLVRDGELRVAALSPAGLPIVNAEASPPQTYRAFGLGDLEGRPSIVVGGPEGVFVVFGGADVPAEVFALTPATLASSFEVSVARDAAGPELSDPVARAGTAVVHEGVLWMASDDGRVVTFDPLAEGEDRWTERADGLAAPLLSQGTARVHGLFESDAEGTNVEVRSFRSEGDPEVVAIDTPVREVTGVNYPESSWPVFAVTTGAGPALVRPAGAATSVVTTPEVGGRLLGLVATDEATAALTASGGNLAYHVFDRGGEQLGTFGGSSADRCVVGPWPDAGTVIEPGSAGSLLHLHDPSSPWDCVVDTRDASALAEVTDRCAPGGEWSVDKGSAPARDFTVEIGRALDELAADDLEAEMDREEDLGASAAEAIQEELSEAGLGVTEAEVDPEAADECAAEEVASVASPVIDEAEAVGSRAVRVEWSWSGGSCLPGRYLVTMCQLADQGTDCADTVEQEVDANPTSARSSLELPARPDRTYRVSVRAVKGSVVSAPSGALLVTTPPVTPDPPVDVSATLRDGTWQLSWSSCLSRGDCDQRPDGFIVSVEGCEGDSLGRIRQRFDVSQRGTSFGADGAGFGGADLLGRRVQFRVATTSGERVSEPVAAGGCTASVRPGRDTSASNVGVSLTGRAERITLAPLSQNRQLTELFGLSRYDEISARLVRGSFESASRTGVLRGPVTFDVDRCRVSGWTVELTPRWNGRDLPAHRSRLTDAAVACDPTVDSSTRISTALTDPGSSPLGVRVTVPGLDQDVDNGLVAGVSGRATCDRAFGGSDELTLSGGSISGDDVAFGMPVPAILDLQGACRISVVVGFTGGGSAAPESRRIDLDRAGGQIVERVLPIAVNRLEAARTGRYEQRSLVGIGREWLVGVRHDGSGVPCSRTYGQTTWTFEVRGARHTDCQSGAHYTAYGEQEGDLDGSGRGTLEVRVQVGGLVGIVGGVDSSTSRTIPVCQLPGGEPERPCVDPCPYDDEYNVNDPECFEPCPYEGKEGIPADHEDCFEPCPYEDKGGLPIDDPECMPPDDPPGNGGGGGDGAGGSAAPPPATLATSLTWLFRPFRRG